VYALATLRNRKYTVVLVVPNKGAPIILKSQANAVLEWRYDVLNQEVWEAQNSNMPQSASLRDLLGITVCVFIVFRSLKQLAAGGAGTAGGARCINQPPSKSRLIVHAISPLSAGTYQLFIIIISCD
jgi:hypothetical protein